MKIKKWLWIIVVALVIGAIVTPTILLLKEQNSKQASLEVQQLQTAFVARYGTSVQLTSVTKPTEFYMFYWKDAEKVYVAMLVDGIWVELGSQALTTEVP